MNPFLLPAGATYARRSRKPLVAVVTTAIVLGAGGVAYAAWNATTDQGSSQAKSVSAQVLTVQAATGAADLYPGASGAVYFTVTNPNPYPVRFTEATFGQVFSDDAGQCLPSAVSTSNKTGLVIDVAANGTTETLSIPAAVTMSAAVQDGCQGRTFTITTTLTGLSR